MIKDLFEEFLQKTFKDLPYELQTIKENSKFYFGYLKSPEPYDVPILIYDKKTKDIKFEVLPPFTDDSKAITVYEKKQFNEFKKKEEE